MLESSSFVGAALRPEADDSESREPQPGRIYRILQSSSLRVRHALAKQDGRQASDGTMGKELAEPKKAVPQEGEVVR